MKSLYCLLLFFFNLFLSTNGSCQTNGFFMFVTKFSYSVSQMSIDAMLMCFTPNVLGDSQTAAIRFVRWRQNRATWSSYEIEVLFLELGRAMNAKEKLHNSPDPPPTYHWTHATNCEQGLYYNDVQGTFGIWNTYRNAHGAPFYGLQIPINFWTGTDEKGESYQLDCNGWTTPDPGEMAAGGTINIMGGKEWTFVDAQSVPCNQTRNLYCFQSDVYDPIFAFSTTSAEAVPIATSSTFDEPTEPPTAPPTTATASLSATGGGGGGVTVATQSTQGTVGGTSNAQGSTTTLFVSDNGELFTSETSSTDNQMGNTDTDDALSPLVLAIIALIGLLLIAAVVAILLLMRGRRRRPRRAATTMASSPAASASTGAQRDRPSSPRSPRSHSRSHSRKTIHSTSTANSAMLKSPRNAGGASRSRSRRASVNPHAGRILYDQLPNFGSSSTMYGKVPPIGSSGYDRVGGAEQSTYDTVSSPLATSDASHTYDTVGGAFSSGNTYDAPGMPLGNLYDSTAAPLDAGAQSNVYEATSTPLGGLYGQAPTSGDENVYDDTSVPL